MTAEEEEAICIFINMVKELNDAEDFGNKLMKSKNKYELISGHIITDLVNSFRADRTREEIDQLIETIIEQQEV